MESFLSFLSENYKWLFSGAGVLLFTFILKIIFSKKEQHSTQVQARNNSTAVQISGNHNKISLGDHNGR